jgi:hypothetical protein
LLKCNGALLTLSRFEVSVEPPPCEAHEKHIFQSRAALGVQSVLRMILEGTWQLPSVSNKELLSVPIWSFHRAYLAALLSLELGFVDGDGEKWTIYIQAVKLMLTTLEPRYKLAGMIIIYLRSMFKQSLTVCRRLSDRYRGYTITQSAITLLTTSC